MPAPPRREAGERRPECSEAFSAARPARVELRFVLALALRTRPRPRASIGPLDQKLDRSSKVRVPEDPQRRHDRWLLDKCARPFQREAGEKRAVTLERDGSLRHDRFAQVVR